MLVIFLPANSRKKDLLNISDALEVKSVVCYTF